MLKIPPINNDVYKIAFLPNYSFKKGNKNPEKIAPILIKYLQKMQLHMLQLFYHNDLF